MEIINLLLLDDHAMFRESLARLLQLEPDFNVAGEFSSAAEALGALPRCTADLILLDINLGEEKALEFVLAARKKGFDGKFLAVTAGITEQEAVQLVQAGVAGILHKHRTTTDLCSRIRQVAAGEVFLEQNYFAALYRSLDRTKPQNRSVLTERDKTVLRFVLQGMSNRQIADRLHISESGVKSSLRQLFDKLGVRTRSQLVRIALEQYRDQL